MKNKYLTTILLLCFLFLGFNYTSLSPQAALNILVTMGRKAWVSFTLGADTTVFRITKFGYNKDVDTGTTENLAAFGGVWNQYSLTAQTLSFVSTSANDAAAGTGARQLLVSCIDEDGLQVDFSVILNGITPVVSTQTCKFINRIAVFSAGSLHYNDGDINATQSGSGIQLAQVPAMKSVTQQIMYYVPSDSDCYIDDLTLNARKTAGGASPKIEFNVRVYSQFVGVLYDIREYFIDTAVTAEVIAVDFKAERLSPNEIVTVDVVTDTNNTIVTGHMDLTCRRR